MRTPFPESCRQVKGSKQERICITSEQRAEPQEVGRAGFARYSKIECRRKAEQEWYRRGNCAFVSYYGDKGVFLSPAGKMKKLK